MVKVSRSTNGFQFLIAIGRAVLGWQNHFRLVQLLNLLCIFVAYRKIVKICMYLQYLIVPSSGKSRSIEKRVSVTDSPGSWLFAGGAVFGSHNFQIFYEFLNVNIPKNTQSVHIQDLIVSGSM